MHNIVTLRTLCRRQRKDEGRKTAQDIVYISKTHVCELKNDFRTEMIPSRSGFILFNSSVLILAQ